MLFVKNDEVKYVFRMIAKLLEERGEWPSGLGRYN